jgi:hypothetical protein
MSSIIRLKQIQRKLKIGESNYPLTYWTLLQVDKYKHFEELNNLGFVNVNRGQEFLGTKSIEQLPIVKQKIKKIYEEQQAEIRNDPKVGGALVFVNLKEGVDI